MKPNANAQTDRSHKRQLRGRHHEPHLQGTTDLGKLGIKPAE
jgi:hypothetical protein